MTNKPQPTQDTAWLDEILHNLQAEFFSDHTRVLKGKDTPAEMDSNNADTLARTKAAILAHLNTGQPKPKTGKISPAAKFLDVDGVPQPLENGELDDQITLAVAKRFLHERYDAVTQLFKAELERRERELILTAEEIPRRMAKDYANTPLGERQNAYHLLCEASQRIYQLTPTPESKQNEETRE